MRKRGTQVQSGKMNKYLSRITLNENGLNVPIKVNPKRPTPKQIIIKTADFKDKERILKAGKKKQLVTY